MNMRAVTKAPLGRRAYVDPAWYEAEMTSVFERSWISIGLASQAPLPGDIRPVNIAGQPLLVTRAKDGEIHVLQNACRHRGLMLVDKPCRRANGLITCPYHRWSYTLEGSLKGTPFFDKATPRSGPDEATRQELGLFRVRSALWMDIVFVNLSGTAEPFETFIAPLQERWKNFASGDLASIILKDYQLECNWKLAVENFLDPYHIFAVHSQAGPAHLTVKVEDVVVSDAITGLHYAEAHKNMPKPEYSLPEFENLPTYLEYGQDIIAVFPNSLVILDPYMFQVLVVLPSGPELSHEIYGLYGPTAILEERNAAAQKFQEDLYVGINEQDLPICRDLQAGRHSPATDHTHFVDSWDELTVRFEERVRDLVADRGTNG